MGRPKEFDHDEALDSAVSVFREHGFEGTSAQMLVSAMGIGRQSIYNTWGDKWGLYCAAVRRYSAQECQAHYEALNNSERAIDGIKCMLDRVVDQASQNCLGIFSILEFGVSRPDLVDVRRSFSDFLGRALRDAVAAAQAQGDIEPRLDAGHLAAYLHATLSTIRLSARSGASRELVSQMAELALRAMR